MRFVLIRHGQSTNNLLWAQTRATEGRLPDTPLTDLGHEQARRLADALAGGVLPWKLTHLYTSLMTRAVQTAAPIAEALDLPLHTRVDGFEVGGPFDEDAGGNRTHHPGANRSALLEVSPRLQLADDIAEEGWWKGPYETADAVPARAKKLVAEMREAHGPDDVVGLVTHGFFTQFLLLELLAVESSSVWFTIHNTAVSVVADTVGEDSGYTYDVVAELIGWTGHLTADQLSE